MNGGEACANRERSVDDVGYSKGRMPTHEANETYPGRPLRTLYTIVDAVHTTAHLRKTVGSLRICKADQP